MKKNLLRIVATGSLFLAVGAWACDGEADADRSTPPSVLAAVEKASNGAATKVVFLGHALNSSNLTHHPVAYYETKNDLICFSVFKDGLFKSGMKVANSICYSISAQAEAPKLNRMIDGNELSVQTLVSEYKAVEGGIRRGPMIGKIDSIFGDTVGISWVVEFKNQSKDQCLATVDFFTNEPSHVTNVICWKSSDDHGGHDQ